MGIFLLIFLVCTGVLFVVLMAIQTDKAQPGGVMGLGASGGKMSGSIDMPVGAERILKPLSKWSAIGFLFIAALAAIHGEEKLTAWHFLAAVAAYLVIMLQGNKIWERILLLFGPQS